VLLSNEEGKNTVNITSPSALRPKKYAKTSFVTLFGHRDFAFGFLGH